MSRTSLNRLTPYMFVAPAGLVMILALFYPIAYMVWGRFHDWDPSQSLGEADYIGVDQ